MVAPAVIAASTIRHKLSIEYGLRLHKKTRRHRYSCEHVSRSGPPSPAHRQTNALTWTRYARLRLPKTHEYGKLLQFAMPLPRHQYLYPRNVPRRKPGYFHLLSDSTNRFKITREETGKPTSMISTPFFPMPARFAASLSHSDWLAMLVHRRAMLYRK